MGEAISGASAEIQDVTLAGGSIRTSEAVIYPESEGFYADVTRTNDWDGSAWVITDEDPVDSGGGEGESAACAGRGSTVVSGSTPGFDVAICDDGSGRAIYVGSRKHDGAETALPVRFAAEEWRASRDGYRYYVGFDVLLDGSWYLVVEDPSGTTIVSEDFESVTVGWGMVMLLC